MKNLQRILKIADKAYPDGLVGQAAKGRRVDDGLAAFIYREIKETAEGVTFREQARAAADALIRARAELDTVINALEKEC